jgi:8-oxo-dGTP pyrophosphatase MutT (NUDIX family)
MDNLKREVKEETGLGINGKPKLIEAQDILRIEDKHVVRLTYIGEADGEVILSDEHDQYGWFSVDEMDKLEPMDIYFKEVISLIK